MTEMQKANTARLDAALDGQTAIVRIFGRATFAVAADLKQFGASAMQHGCRRLALDVENCETMDSTFIGVMTGLAVRLKQSGGAGVFVLNLSEKNRDILQTLGVDRILQCHLAGAAPDDVHELLRRTTEYCPLLHAAQDQQAAAANMLEAHDTLIGADPANLMKFKDVVDYLRRDLKGKEP